MADGVGLGDGFGVRLGDGFGAGRCGWNDGPGVANGAALNELRGGASSPAITGAGVTIAIAPFGVTLMVACVRARICEPAPKTKFRPLRNAW